MVDGRSVVHMEPPVAMARQVIRQGENPATLAIPSVIITFLGQAKKVEGFRTCSGFPHHETRTRTNAGVVERNRHRR